MVVVRFLDAQKTILRWLLIGTFFQTGDVIDGRIRQLRKDYKHKVFSENITFPPPQITRKKKLLSQSQFYAFYVVCQQLTKGK